MKPGSTGAESWQLSGVVFAQGLRLLGNFEKISFWKTPVAKCGDGRTCVPYYRWVTDYIAVLGGR